MKGKIIHTLVITIIQVVYRNAKDMKITFEDYAGELTNDKMKELTAKLKKTETSTSHILTFGIHSVLIENLTTSSRMDMNEEEAIIDVMS